MGDRIKFVISPTYKMEYITVITQLLDQRVISPTYKWSILGLLTIY